MTRGLLQKMDHLELEGVVAHELSHIGNYDIRLETMVVVLVGLVALLADFMLRFTIWGAGGRMNNRGRNGGSGVLIIYAVALIAAILAPIAAQFIQLALSRQRDTCRRLGALLRAIRRAWPARWRRSPATRSRWRRRTRRQRTCTSPVPLTEHRSWLNNLFSTHPPIEDRIKRLRAM